MSRIFYCATTGNDRSINLQDNSMHGMFGDRRTWFDQSPVLIDETRISEFSFMQNHVFVLAASERPFPARHVNHLPTFSTDVDELIELAKYHSPILRVLAGPLTNHLLGTEVVTDVVLHVWPNMHFSGLCIPQFDQETYKLIQEGEVFHCDNPYGGRSIVKLFSRV